MARIFEVEGFMDCKKASTVAKRLIKKLDSEHAAYFEFDMDWLDSNNGAEVIVNGEYAIRINDLSYSENEPNWYYNLIVWGAN